MRRVLVTGAARGPAAAYALELGDRAAYDATMRRQAARPGAPGETR